MSEMSPIMFFLIFAMTEVLTLALVKVAQKL